MSAETVSGIVCGGSVCPTCGRDTPALIGPCEGCCDSHARTGRVPRRKPLASHSKETDT